MSPEVVQRKISKILGYLEDLEKARDLDFEGYADRHYEVERLLQLLHECASDVVIHLLRKDYGFVDSARDGFERAAASGWIPRPMAKELIEAGGMRNILVHQYETIDDRRVFDAIPKALALYPKFLAAIRAGVETR